MSYLGLTPSKYSSGDKHRRGHITKAGNSHVRRVLIEAAWTYRYPPRKPGRAARHERARCRESLSLRSKIHGGEEGGGSWVAVLELPAS